MIMIALPVLTWTNGLTHRLQVVERIDSTPPKSQYPYPRTTPKSQLLTPGPGYCGSVRETFGVT